MPPAAPGSSEYRGDPPICPAHGYNLRRRVLPGHGRDRKRRDQWSVQIKPFLALHIFRALPSAQVLANSLIVKDAVATEITKHIYEEIFSGKTADALNMARLKVKEDRWKPVLFCESNREIFRIDLKKGRKKKTIRPKSRYRKRLASSHEDLETFSGPRALVCLSRFLIPIQLNQSPISLCNSLSLGTNYPLVLSPPSVFGSIFTRPDIRELVASIGLAPKETLSGSSIKGKPRLCKVGQARLRKALYMPALVSIQCNPVVNAFYNRLKAKDKNGKVIVCAIMRKLVHIIFGTLKSGKKFDPNSKPVFA